MRIQYGPNPTMGPICRASGSGYCVGLKMIGVQVLVVCLDLALLIACVCLAHASIVHLSWHSPLTSCQASASAQTPAHPRSTCTPIIRSKKYIGSRMVEAGEGAYSSEEEA